MNSIISPDNHWVIWTSLIGVCTLSLYLEQNFKICQRITGALLAMVGGMVLSNTGFLPTESISYDIINTYLVPLVIPLLLMKTDVRRIFKETGRMFGAFHLSALGTIMGSFVAVFFLHGYIPELGKIVPAMTGSYIGGGVNFVALKETFNPPVELSNATLVADSGVMVLYFLFLLAFSSFAFTRRIFPISEQTEKFFHENADDDKGFMDAKEISVMDVVSSLFIAFVIAMISVKVSDYFAGDHHHPLVQAILGQKYILLTTLTVCFPLFFPQFAKKLNGPETIGVFFVFLFFALIGIPASMKAVIFGAPLMLVFCAIILAFNFLVTFVLGKLFKFEMEELVLAAVVTSGGPMNGAAIAASKGWKSLIVPSLLIGVWGYIVGNYLGYLVGLILKYIPSI